MKTPIIFNITIYYIVMKTKIICTCSILFRKQFLWKERYYLLNSYEDSQWLLLLISIMKTTQNIGTILYDVE